MITRMEIRCLNCDHERYITTGDQPVCRKCRQSKTLDDFLVLNVDEIDPTPHSGALYGKAV